MKRLFASFVTLAFLLGASNVVAQSNKLRAGEDGKSILNTTTTALGSSETYTGTGEENSLPHVGVYSFSDVAGTLYFDFSVDGTNWHTFPTSGFTCSANIPEFHTAVKMGRYFRVRYVNGSSAQSTFRLYTYYGENFLPSNAPLNQSISNDQDAIISRSVLIGAIPDGSYQNIQADGVGFSTSDLLENGATYDSGVLSLVGYTQVQSHILSDVDGTVVIDFIRDSAGTDILRTLTIPYTGGSGYQTFAAPAFTPYVRYRFTADEAGQSDFYFDTKFLTKSVNGQLLGVDAFISPLMVSQLNRSVLVGRTSGNYYANVAIEPVTNELKVSIPRSAFGEVETVRPTPIVQIDFVYNINADIVDSSTTGSGTVTQANSMAVLSTTAASSSSAKIQSKRLVKYRPGQGTHIRGTALFTTGAANSTQLFGAGDDVNGVFFGYNGTSFGVLHRNNSIDTWIPQTSWNGDIMNGSGGVNNQSSITLDPTKGNVYEIQFQWLGFGSITFSIENPATGTFIPVHNINYANNNTVPSFTNPSFPIIWEVENTTNATNIVLKGASALAEVEGIVEYLGPRNAIGNTKSGVTTTLTNILTVRNKSTYQSTTNRTPINIIKYTVAVDGTKPAEFQLIKNTTLGGSPSYTDISTNTSVVEYDTAGTTITGGQVIDFDTIAKDGSITIVPSPIDVFLNPGETLTLAVAATTSTTDATASIRWVEEF